MIERADPARARLADWPERLAAHIEARRHLPFEWGANDCVSFAAAGVAAMTGMDAERLLPTQWTDALSAARRIRELGGLVDAVTGVLGDPTPGPAARRAWRGDVVACDCDGEPILGLVVGGGHWCAPGAAGLVFRPMREAVMAWRV